MCFTAASVAGDNEKSYLMKKWFKLLSFPFLALIGSCARTAERPVHPAVQPAPVSFHSLSAKSLEGEVVSFEQFRGKKVLLVNTASECGHTPQYDALEQLYKANSDRLVVLGFPSNDFGGQEPGDAKQILSFCTKNYGVTFPMFEKVKTSGSDISEVYAWLTDKSKNGWNAQAPAWNFCKYLIDEQGQLIAFFPSAVQPNDPAIAKHLQ